MCTKTLSLFVALSSFCSFASARAEGETRQPPPELKKTVDAFAGRWSLVGTVTLPGAQPAGLKSKMVCTKAAGGKAVSCLEEGMAAGLGPMQGAYLIGYDTFGKRVHFMAITSDEAVHDHPCSWSNEHDLTCDPLKGGMNGSPITEEFVVSFNEKTLAIKVKVTLPDGGVMLIDIKGKRA